MSPDQRKTILERWKLTERELTEIMEVNPSMRGLVLGYVAEYKLRKMFFSEPCFSDVHKSDDHDRKKKGEFFTFQLDQDECKKCTTCIKTFGCPAIYLADDDSVHINEGICNGCGVCAFVCPFNAIHENKGGA